MLEKVKKSRGGCGGEEEQSKEWRESGEEEGSKGYKTWKQGRTLAVRAAMLTNQELSPTCRELTGVGPRVPSHRKGIGIWHKVATGAQWCQYQIPKTLISIRYMTLHTTDTHQSTWNDYRLVRTWSYGLSTTCNNTQEREKDETSTHLTEHY